MIERVKLCILSGGGIFLRGSWALGAGGSREIGRNWRVSSDRTTHGPAMDMGPAANERAHQTVSCIRRWIFSMVILAIWCRGEVDSP
jgi:hypothetical protein